jgi:hypothetical protein
MLGIDLAGGSLIFLLFVVAYVVAVSYGLYGRRGSAINRRAYAKVYASAPGAARGENRSSGRDREIAMWSRGTR